MADVPQVPVTAVAGIGREGKMDAVLLAVRDLILTGLHGPDIGHSPGSDDLQIRSQSLDTQLETNLVIALTGSAVADSDCVLFTGDFYQLLCDGRTRHGLRKRNF